MKSTFSLSVIHLMSEAAPFAKTGGLADVGGALPQAQAGLGAKVKVLLPFYRRVREGDHALEPTGVDVPVEIDGKVLGARLWRCLKGGVEYLFVDQPDFFDREGLYGEGGKDYPDNILRFGFFCRAAAEAILSQGWEVDVLHCHDWQTGLLPVYLSTVYRDREVLRRAAVIYTIHNLAYQGLADFSFLPRLHLPPELDDPGMLEFFGRLSPMKGGIRFSDYVTTVSRTYAREILTARYGCGLEGFLRLKANRIRGIRNGIDVDEWDPSKDPHIEKNYSKDDFSGKAECTRALRREMGLDDAPGRPLVGFIGRLVSQKGVDLILNSLEALVARNLQFVFLGEGEKGYAAGLEEMARRFPGKVGGVIGYGEPIAHRVTAGADIFLMPSRFEPCGLNQQYALRYGSVPVVHKTGGLADTVIHATEKTLANGRATGFVFRSYSSKDLLWAVDRALDLWRVPDAWHTLMKNGMSLDLSWERAARKYLGLYRAARREAREGKRPDLAFAAQSPHRGRWGTRLWMDWGPPLPSRYGVMALDLMTAGPFLLYAWWEVPVQDRVDAGGIREGKYSDLLLVLEDIGARERKIRPAGSDLGDSWILVEPGRRYRVHLALREGEGGMRILCSSPVVRTPLSLEGERKAAAAVAPAGGVEAEGGKPAEESPLREEPEKAGDLPGPGRPGGAGKAASPGEEEGPPPPASLPSSGEGWTGGGEDPDLPPSYGKPREPWDVGGWKEVGDDG